MVSIKRDYRRLRKPAIDIIPNENLGTRKAQILVVSINLDRPRIFLNGPRFLGVFRSSDGPNLNFLAYSNLDRPIKFCALIQRSTDVPTQSDGQIQ